MICILLTYVFSALTLLARFFALKCGQKPCKSVNGNLQAKTVVLRTAKRIHSEEYVSVCKIKLLQRCKQRVAYAGHNFSWNNPICAALSFFSLRLQFWHDSLTNWVLQAWGRAGPSSCSQSNEALADSPFTLIWLVQINTSYAKTFIFIYFRNVLAAGMILLTYTYSKK